MSTLAAREYLYEALDDRTIEILSQRDASNATRRRGWLVRRVLLGADVLGLAVAFLVAQLIYSTHTHVGELDRLAEFAVFALSLPLWIVAAKVYRLYDRDEERANHSTADDFAGVFHLVTGGTFFLYASSRLTGQFNPEFGKLFLFWFLAIGATVALRFTGRTYCRKHVLYLQNTIVVGAGHLGQTIARKLINHPEYGLNLVGLVESRPTELQPSLRHLAVLGDLDDLTEIVTLLDVERVIFESDDHRETLLQAVDDVRRLDVQVDIIPRLVEGMGPSVSFHAVEGLPVVSLPPTRLPWSSLLIKRALDIGVALAGLIVLAPLFLAVALLIKRDSPGPVFYRHTRVGKNRKPIRLFKFRTMYIEMCRGEGYGGDDAEATFDALMKDPLRSAEFGLTYKLQDDPRVTRLGRFLRRTSLDELPQLINVLLGDISLVGPRALTEDELDTYYGVATDDLLAIKPGVTGYWQVNGRSGLAYGDRVRLDLAYAGGWSLGLDLAILARTVRVLAS